ncbi:MAG: cysteine hydrolase [Actinobacteria bacterium]|nr:cysteine hydrolase [Actinomycetota bacterium]MCG2817934.1 cysteine hydrolase [Actinomycetes bacterium]MBU4178306.1 cysteine hydrolase [Actinomycetota bacterium]MBU4219112.1 cysteine hydrolase [Actinomycetota bacterium]MBU4358399.1 cysteine hydrolase [Actinomycetota bacterium]
MSLFTGESALLVVDMINDFVRPDGALPVPAAMGIVPYVASLADEARRLGIPVVYVDDSHDPDDKEFEDWPVHAVEGTDGARVVDKLEPNEGDHVVTCKCYSGFFGTKLDELLGELGVEHVVVTGTVTNICVYATCLDAYMRGYRITVPRNGVAGLNEEEHEFALRQIEQVLFGEVI